MFTVLTDINWLSVLLAAIASFAVAGLYFTKIIAKAYVVALGRENAPAPASSPVTNLGPLVCVLVTTITSAVLIEALDITGIGDAVVFGLIVGVGYLTAMTFQIAINPNFPRPLFYGAINAPFFIVTSVLTASIIVGLR
ncbi:DUF1761 domain-containing protein [Actinoplanes rectilineatus]|uniref:DUF1761 domain-containing protein n=1 Tax=Actinoplanes rectilineatus TaxID=113571 RepID=UPI0005F2A00E|nr:DUF1761 domain-containing protein [Actinoplanes rectilineatus]